jgi:hypothetical protein
MITEAERALVRRRTRLARLAPAACVLLLVAVLGLWGYLFLTRSLLVNPWALLERLEAGNVDAATLAALAVLGAGGFFGLGIVMLGLVALLWSAARVERQLLDIIQRLDR